MFGLYNLFLGLTANFKQPSFAFLNGVLAQSSTSEMNLTGLWLTLVGLLLVLVLIPLFDKSSIKFTIKSIAYAAIMIALAFGLSYARIWRNPQGGSITLFSTFPIMLYSYMFGTKKGVLVGAIFGTLQLLVDPFIIHPIQALLDYPIPFAMLGLAGMLRNTNFTDKHFIKFLIGGIACAALRFFTHVLSGVFAFNAYATGDIWVYSLVYNSITLADVAIAVAAGALLLLNKSVAKLVISTAESKPKQTD